jgi:putative heme iron utilization protein
LIDFFSVNPPNCDHYFALVGSPSLAWHNNRQLKLISHLPTSESFIVTRQEQPTGVQEEFQELRESLKTIQIATLDGDGKPLASYAPYVRLEQKYYLYLSELAKHTVNLIDNGSVSLLLIESEENCRNLFARRRIVLQGEAQTIERDLPLFTQVLAEFERQFGGIINVIEPLQDFHLFQIKPVSGRFIRGFAEAFEISGPGLDVIEHIGADKL